MVRSVCPQSGGREGLTVAVSRVKFLAFQFSNANELIWVRNKTDC